LTTLAYIGHSARARQLMKAVLLKSSEDGGWRAELTEVGVPAIGPRELLVAMKACGLCGTDVEKLRGRYTASMPVLGHEAVGVVVSKGSDVVGYEEGDRVFPHHHVPCKLCAYCRAGSETMCEEYRKSNLDPCGFAEFFRVPEWNIKGGGVLKLPPTMGFEEAALIEPVACCIRGLDRAGVAAHASVLVAGAGPVGMIHAILLRQMNANVLISDINRSRLGFAEKIGFKQTIDASKGDVGAWAKELTGGRGVDLAVVASGSPQAVIQALKATRKGGKVCIFGAIVKGSVLDYDISDVFNSEISIVTSYGATETETPKALNLLAERPADFRSLITHRFTLDQFEPAVNTSEEGTGMKVLLTS
jgi:L-iditol 2-dehydrogenase